MDTQLCLSASTATAPGTARLANQDAVAERRADDLNAGTGPRAVWALADGVGSQADAEPVSRMAVDAVVDAVWQAHARDPAGRIREAIQQTNALLIAGGKTRPAASARSGTTILVAAIDGDRLSVGHAGRSRAYLFRDGSLRQLTSDHTWVAEQVRAGALSPEAALKHPRRNVVTRALGVRPSIEVDVTEATVRAGDVILLCSDGLYRALDEHRVALLLRRYAADAASVLVDEARRLGARDDVTAITVAVERCLDGRDAPATPRPAHAVSSPPLAASLDVDVTLASVMQRLRELTGSQRAAILLQEPDGSLRPAFSTGGRGPAERHSPSRTVAEEALRTRRPVLISDVVQDARFRDADSVIQGAIQSILAVPLMIAGSPIGVLYADSGTESAALRSVDPDLLTAFAAQAAAAIQNARLHQELLARSRELEAVRRRQDALIRSLGSALIAVDTGGQVTEWNPATVEIFGVGRERAIGASLSETLPGPLVAWMSALAAQVELGNQTILIGDEWEGAIGSRPRVILSARVARLRDPEGRMDGFVFLVSDRTDFVLIDEARRQESDERERLSTRFSRYLAPPVVERLLSSPEEIQLGGSRQEVTILFSDIRGFTSYSEHHSPEEVVAMLNAYLALATAEIFTHHGTLDKFLGDGALAIFGAPLEMPGHELAAVRAAVGMLARLDQVRRGTGTRIGFGIGINSGTAIVGNIGTPQLMSYTAIGDVVNVAARLQAEARTGEILLGEATFARIADHVEVEELGPLYLKGRAEPVRTFKLIRLLDGS